MITILLSVSCLQSVDAQSTVDRGKTEIGYSYQWFDRNLEGHPPDNNEWETAAVYLSRGVLDWMTLSLNGGIWLVENDDLPDYEYHRYVVGAGVSIKAWQYRSYELVAGFNFSEVMDMDRGPDKFHKRTKNYSSSLKIRREFHWNDTSVGVSGGLAFAKDEGRTYLWGTQSFIEGESSGNVGVVIGARALLFERIAPFVNATYIENLQPEVGIGVRF